MTRTLQVLTILAILLLSALASPAPGWGQTIPRDGYTIPHEPQLHYGYRVYLPIEEAR
jgi:hypothetical protein